MNRAVLAKVGWRIHCVQGLQFTHRFNIWVWSSMRNRLPTTSNLNFKGMNDVLFCSFAINTTETLEHILFECPLFIRVWLHVFRNHFILFLTGSLMDRWDVSRQKLSLHYFIQEWLFCWPIQTCHNRVLFQNLSGVISKILAGWNNSFISIRFSRTNLSQVPFKDICIKNGFALLPMSASRSDLSRNLIVWERGFLMLNFKILMCWTFSIPAPETPTFTAARAFIE